MNIREGARRMQYIGRIALSLTAAAFVLIILVALIGHYTSKFTFPFFPATLLLCFYPAPIGTLFLVTGWIVEGFAEPQPNSTAHEHAGD
jgi:hypothetical protein